MWPHQCTILACLKSSIVSSGYLYVCILMKSRNPPSSRKPLDDSKFEHILGGYRHTWQAEKFRPPPPLRYTCILVSTIITNSGPPPPQPCCKLRRTWCVIDERSVVYDLLGTPFACCVISNESRSNVSGEKVQIVSHNYDFWNMIWKTLSIWVAGYS